ncbi:MAG: ABC transporter permease [Isosphaeraceae bacterium]
MTIAEETSQTAAASHPIEARQGIRIEPVSGWARLQLSELWRYRELAMFLVWRDVKVRYKQTALGASWAILQPFFTMLVFSIFFGRLARIPSDGVPYPLYAFAALVPWTYFSVAMSLSSNSLVGSANLIKKVYFPRLLVPISVVLSGLVDLGMAFLMLLAMMAYYGVAPGPGLAIAPLFILLSVATALGVGLWLSALNVEYRDVRYVVPFLTQFWMFATPIAYPSSLVPPSWRAAYGLNPMVGVIDGFRWAVVGAPELSATTLAASTTSALALLVSGAFYFRRMERTFADMI